MKWDPYENGYLGEFFSVSQYDSKDEPCVVKDARELKAGTSYSEHMLDLNELMEKGVVHRDDKIDLSEMPEIETIQAASQEQLDMLTSESKKQIKQIKINKNLKNNKKVPLENWKNEELRELMECYSKFVLQQIEQTDNLGQLQKEAISIQEFIDNM